MKRKTLRIAAALAAAALLAACSRDAGTQINSGANSTAAAATPAPTAEPTPEPVVEPYEANVLTGEPKDADYPEGQRITAVMVNNIYAARPQRGLSNAEILFEIVTEGGITRFMPLFVDYNDIGEIGPVRSGRDQHFQIILPWQALYVHEGQSVVVDQYVANYDYDELNIKSIESGGNGYRDNTRVNWAGASRAAGTLSTEHTLYTNTEGIANYIATHNVDMSRTYKSTFFNFVDYRDENPIRDLSLSVDSAYSDKYGPIVTDGEFVSVTHSASYRSRFLYDGSTTTYKMQQYYGDAGWREVRDENNDQQLAFTNLIVLFTDIHTYPQYVEKGLQEVDYASGGVGYYCYGGKCEKIYWQKGTALEALRLYYLDANGQCSNDMLDVNIGKSYVAIVDVNEADNFVASTLADAGL